VRRRATDLPRLEVLWRQLENVNALIRHADTKLTTLIAFAGVAGGGLFVVSDRADPAWVVFFSALCGLLIAASGVLALAALLPRRPYRPGRATEHIYFRAIAKEYEGPDAYTASVLKDGVDLSVNLARQIQINAVIADRKFALSSGATLCLMAAGLLLAVVAGHQMFG
jgi:hypothetical protein